ncbi:MAG: hypothetical protein AB1586_14520 [Pseudomonadota bacterium]|jgi:hypothetical protein
MSLRFYVWPERGEPQRLPHAAFNHRGRKRFPQFANTRQRVAQVIFDDAGPTTYFSVSAHYLAFDGDGFAAPDVRGAMNVMSAHYELERAKREVVPQLTAVREAHHQLNKLNAARQWVLSEADIDKIKRDLTGKQRIPGAKGIEGSA